MVSVAKALPKAGKQFRGCGCTAHWQVAPNPSEKKLGVRRKTFCRKGEAQARAGEIRNQIHRGVFVRDDKTTVAEWAEQWLADAAGRVRPGTLYRYRNHVQLRIAPMQLRTLPMTAVRPDHVRAWITEMRNAGNFGVGKDNTVAPSGEIAMTVATLRAMFNQWAADGRPLPHGNPVVNGLVPKQPERPRYDPLTVEEVHRWRDALPDYMRIIVDVEAYTGGRMSEVLGLREEDIVWVGRDVTRPMVDQLYGLAREPAEQYEARRVMLRFQRQLVGDRPGERERSLSAPMKNRRANRDVPLPQWLARTLVDHLIRWPTWDGWLFTDPYPGYGVKMAADPVPAAPAQPYRQGIYLAALSKAADRAGISLPPGTRSHALRHHCVSVLRDGGFSDQAIAEWIGDSPLTIQATYGRPMPGTADRIATALTEMYTAPRHLRAVGE
jgi:integrase